MLKNGLFSDPYSLKNTPCVPGCTHSVCVNYDLGVLVICLWLFEDFVLESGSFADA